MIHDRSQFICTGNFCVTDETNIKLLRLVADQSVGSCENFQLSVWSQLSSLLKFIYSKSCHVFIQMITTAVYKRTLSIILLIVFKPRCSSYSFGSNEKNWNGSKTGICKTCFTAVWPKLKTHSHKIAFERCFTSANTKFNWTYSRMYQHLWNKICDQCPASIFKWSKIILCA